MIVLHYVPFWLGHTETWIYGQICALPSDIESHVLCERTGNLDQFPWPRINSIDIGSALGAWQAVRKAALRLGIGSAAECARRRLLIQRAKGLGAAILHSHFGDAACLNARAVRRAGLKHVVTFYGQEVQRLPTIEPSWRQRYSRLFSSVDRVLCEGPHMARCLAGLGCHPDKLKIHALGVDLNRIEFSPRSWRPGTPLRVLLAATFREKKGIPSGIHALGKLKSEVELEVSIAGDASTEPRSRREKSLILAAVRASGLEDRVRFLGVLTHAELQRAACRHHVFLSPSRTASDGDTEGGAPVSIIEMAASGMPVVSTVHCDIPEIILHRQTGLLAAEGDVPGLAEQMRWLIRNPGAWRALAEAARQRIRERFNAATQGQRLAELYRSLASSPRSSGPKGG